jgi:hypothetical protein
MSKFINTDYRGIHTHRLILDSIIIRLEHGENYLDFLNKEIEKYTNNSFWPYTKAELEMLKQLCKSNLTINQITENISLKLINDKFEIKY